MAVAGIYQALLTELPISSVIPDPEVVAALIDASVRIAMATDTRDMGLLAPEEVQKRANEIAAEMQRDDPI